MLDYCRYVPGTWSLHDFHVGFISCKACAVVPDRRWSLFKAANITVEQQQRGFVIFTESGNFADKVIKLVEA